MKRIVLLFIMVSAVMLNFACKMPDEIIPEPVLKSDKDITAFSFSADANAGLSIDKTAVITGTNIEVILPYGLDRTGLKAGFTASGKSVSIGGTAQVSGTTANNFTNPVVYRVTAEDDSYKDYTVIVGYDTISGINPVDGSVTGTSTAELSWSSVAGASGYEVQLAATEAEVASADTQSLTSNNFTPASPPAGRFWYWRVRACSTDGPVTAWSPITKITLSWGTFPVILGAPAAGTQTSDTTPELSWEIYDGAESYEIQFAKEPSASMQASEPLTAADTPYAFKTPLENETVYYWRIRAASTDIVSGETIYSAYSITRSFEVVWGTNGPAEGICFAEELAELTGAAFLGGSYTLSRDIDLSSYGDWTPIGNAASPFTGSFNGNGHTIKGLTINQPDTGSKLGLFGHLRGAVVSNLTLTDVNIAGASEVGAIAGYCYQTATAENTIEDCSASGIIRATLGYGYAGGLIGNAEVGAQNPGTLRVLNSSADCEVSGLQATGGLIGRLNSNWYSSSINSVNSFIISGSHAEGSVSGGSNTGGLIGSICNVYTNFQVTDSWAAGDVSGTSSTGGLIGSISKQAYAGGGSVTSCYAEGGVTGTELHTGGLIGYYTGSTTYVKNSYSTGNVNGAGYTGGLVGRSHEYLSSGSHVYGTIKSCYASGNVTSSDSNTGGLVGYGGYISNSLAVGDVSGDSNVGGFIGGVSGSVTNCYSVGSVTGSSNTGGLAGTGTVSSCFYDMDTSGQTLNDSRGTPMPSTEMKTPETFSNAGWDLAGEETNGTADIWSLDPYWVKNDGYPYLTSLPMR